MRENRVIISIVNSIMYVVLLFFIVRMFFFCKFCYSGRQANKPYYRPKNRADIKRSSTRFSFLSIFAKISENTIPFIPFTSNLKLTFRERYENNEFNYARCFLCSIKAGTN